jgi:hypothetical protein
MNPKQLSLHQLDFCSFRYSSWNSQRSTLADGEIDFEGCDFHADVQKGMDVSFLFPLKSLHFNLQSSRSAQNID